MKIYMVIEHSGTHFKVMKLFMHEEMAANFIEEYLDEKGVDFVIEDNHWYADDYNSYAVIDIEVES